MLTRTLLLTGLRDLLRRPLHTGLMLLGVALGVAVVVAVDLANESARRGFAKSTEAVVGRASHQVLGGPAGVPVELYRRLRLAGAAEAVAPVVEAVGLAEELGRQSVRLLGVDAFAEGPFRDHLGGASLRAPGFARLLTEAGACVVSAQQARRHGLGLASPLHVRLDGRRLELVVRGLLQDDTPARQGALDDLVLVDVGALQRLLGREDALSRLDLIADAEQARAVAALLPPGLRLVAASEQADTIGQLTRAFQLNLTALSLLALLVGMFLISNTVTFSVVQRRAVFGTLRALGVGGGQIFALILAETAAAALAGSALGLGLGLALGRGAVRLVTRTINDLYYVLSVTGVALEPATIVKAVALGVGAALLAAVPAALEAARVEPITALRPSTLEQRARRSAPWLALGGLLTMAAGGVGLGLAGQSLFASFAGLFGIVIGYALLVPLLTLGLLAAAAPALGRGLGVLGRLGARTLARSLLRTGVAIAALTTAVSVTIGVGLMIESFRGTVRNWLELTLLADVYVGAPGRGARATPTLPRELQARLGAVPGVAAVESYRRVRVMSSFGEVPLGASDVRSEHGAALHRFKPGGDPDPWPRVLRGAVVVSEPFAHRHRLPARGGRIELATDRGEREFEVAGVYYDYSTEEGTVLMSRAVYDRFWDDPNVSSIALYAAPGTEPGLLAERVRSALAGTALVVTLNQSLKQEALRVFDRTFAVTNALRLLAVVVAFIGVCSALLALQVERTRELATLQALGLLPGQLALLSLIETGLMGLAAGLLSLPLGALLAAILVDVINVRSFGWTMQLALRPGLFAQAVAVSVAASLLASVYPLRRLRRISIAAALRQE